MTASSDEPFMRRAIALAQAGVHSPQAPVVGCVVVLDGRVIGEGTHAIRAGYDPADHAEVAALRRAGEAVGRPAMPGAVLYSTLQPCGMCMIAGVWAKLGRVVYGAGRAELHASYFEDRDLQTEDSLRDAHREDMPVEGGVLRQDCAALYPAPGERPAREASV